MRQKVLTMISREPTIENREAIQNCCFETIVISPKELQATKPPRSPPPKLPLYLMGLILKSANCGRDSFFLNRGILTASSTLLKSSAEHESEGAVMSIAPSGRLFAWGNNANLQLGIPTSTEAWIPQHRPVRVRLPPVTAFWYGHGSWFARTTRGLYSWGNNAYSKLGLGPHHAQYPHIKRPTFVPIAGVMTTIQTFQYCTFMTVGWGGWAACGHSLFGSLGIGEEVTHSEAVHYPTFVPGSANVRRWYSHEYATFAWTSDQLLACGLNRSGQLGLGHTAQKVPILCPIERFIRYLCVYAHNKPTAGFVYDNSIRGLPLQVVAGYQISFFVYRDRTYAAGLDISVFEFQTTNGCVCQPLLIDLHCQPASHHSEVIPPITNGDVSVFHPHRLSRSTINGLALPGQFESLSHFVGDCSNGALTYGVGLEWPASDSPLVALAIGDGCAFGFDEHGRWWARGANPNGQLGTGDSSPVIDYWKLVTIPGVRAVLTDGLSGRYYFLTTDGVVVTNKNGTERLERQKATRLEPLPAGKLPGRDRTKMIRLIDDGDLGPIEPTHEVCILQRD